MAGIAECKTLRILVGSAPGGSSDMLARDLANTITGTKTVVDNKPGAGGQIAANTLISGNKCDVLVSNPGPWAIHEHSRPTEVKPALTTMSPVGKMAEYPLILTTGPSLAAFKDLPAIIEHSKQREKEGKKPLTYGTGGIGSVPHLAMEKFKRESGLVANHVPFKGSSQAAQSLGAGDQVDFVFDAVTSLVPVLPRGIRMHGASTGEKKDFPVKLKGPAGRVEQFDVKPLFAGGKPFEAHLKVAVLGKLFADGDKDKFDAQVIVGEVNTALNKMLTDPAMKEKYDALGLQLTPGTPAELGAVMKAQSVDWKDLAEKYGKE